MKGIQAYEIGGPDVLKYEDMPEPTAGPGGAVVAIRNVGVNYTDVSSRKGTNPPAAFPWTPGREASGEVIAVGDGVTEVAVGDRVAYAMHTGSYAEQQVVPAWLLVRIPDDMDYATGAATLLQAMTAHFLVNDIAPLAGRPAGVGPRRRRRHGPAADTDAEAHGPPRVHHRIHRREGGNGRRRGSRRRHPVHPAGL